MLRTTYAARKKKKDRRGEKKREMIVHGVRMGEKAWEKKILVGGNPVKWGGHKIKERRAKCTRPWVGGRGVAL